MSETHQQEVSGGATGATSEVAGETHMEKRRFIAIAVAGFLVATLAGPNGPLGGFWGVEDTPGLEGGVLGALMLYSVFEAAAFGIGIAWLVLGRRVIASPSGGTAVYLAIGWMLVSWWLHGSLHQSIVNDNYAALAGIEYGFHLTMIVAGAIVARYVWQQVRAPQPAPAG